MYGAPRPATCEGLKGLYTAPSRSQWPRGLRRRSAVACLLRLWVRILAGARMSVCCECCVLSGRGLCDELITRPEESYRRWCLVSDLETSWMRRSWPTGGRGAVAPETNKQCNETSNEWLTTISGFSDVYRGADKSLARPGRKQATATEDFEFHISYF
jgi:hypothetical protein